MRGLNLGIDFKGGTQMTFRTEQPTSLDQVRQEAAGIGQAGAVIQGRGSSTDGKYTNFQIRTESLTTAEQNELQQDLAVLRGDLAEELQAISRLEAHTLGLNDHDAREELRRLADEKKAHAASLLRHVERLDPKFAERLRG